MKKYKIFIALFGLLIFAGCTPEYDLEFKNGKVHEKLIISDVTKEEVKGFYGAQFSIPKENKRYINSFKNNTVKYQYTYSFNSFTKSNMVSLCYNAHNFLHEGNTYFFETGFKFNCLPYQVSDYEMLKYDELLVKIKVTNYKVVKHNADEVDNNIYIWKINKENYQEKSVSIKFKEIKKKKIKKNYIKYILISLIIGIGLIILILLYALGLNKKRNKL